MTLDAVTGLYYSRNRNYSPSLGRWINQDPAGYINGANTYQFVMGNPTTLVDPFGLSPPFGESQMNTLAGDIEAQLASEGPATPGNFNGWTPRNAAMYVAYEMEVKGAASQMYDLGKGLLTLPGEVEKELLEEMAAELKLRAKGLNDLIKEARKKHVAMDFYLGKWGRKSTCLTANIVIVYFPKTQKFIGSIYGNVGKLADAPSGVNGAPMLPGPGNPLHPFWYPFTGSVQGQPSGWPFITGWSITGIAPGSWRYNGNP